LLNNNTTDKILNFIKSNNMGCSSSEISKKLKINRVTITKYLSVLNSQGLIKYKDIGMAKSWYIEKSPILEILKNDSRNNLKDMLNFMGKGVVILDKELKIVWINKLVQEDVKDIEKIKGDYCYKALRDNDHICENCDIANNMNKGKTYKVPNECIKNFKSMIASPIFNQDKDIVGVIEILDRVE